MSLRTLISLMTAFIMLSSGKCEKDIENTSMEGYIFEGKSFLSKVYFDPNRENAVVEIQVGKFGFYDTLHLEVYGKDDSVVLEGCLLYTSPSPRDDR